MKRKFLLFIVLFSIVFSRSYAQISKGSIFLGGQINFTSYSISGMNSQKSNSFTFSPAIGKAIKDNMVVGVDITYAHVQGDQDTVPLNETTDVFGAGVFMRRYVPLGKGFYVFGQGRFGASTVRGTSSRCR